MRSRLHTAAITLISTAALIVVPLATAPAGAVSAEKPQPGKPVTVMTRNIYLGADINRPVTAALTAQAQGGTAQQVLFALANATHVTRAIVDETNFPVRAALLADEIARTEPDLIGLQEVALWRHGPLELADVGHPDAEVVDYDFLQILLDELAARGVHYTAAKVGVRADVEAPSFAASPADADARDIRLTMHDVILVHDEDGLEVTATGDQIYSYNLIVPLLGTTISFARGFQWADVRAGANRLRFINTHLEAFRSDLAYAQAAQLLASAPSSTRTNVFVCDCNSDPLNDAAKTDLTPPDNMPHNGPYNLITGDDAGEGNFTDQWLKWASAEEGWTSGLSELVNDDPEDADFDHRIDMIFARTPGGEGLDVDRGEVTGTDPADRDHTTGLWPSDHGGVVLRLRGF